MKLFQQLSLQMQPENNTNSSSNSFPCVFNIISLLVVKNALTIDTVTFFFLGKTI